MTGKVTGHKEEPITGVLLNGHGTKLSSKQLQTIF